jgi:hypothetical protein
MGKHILCKDRLGVRFLSGPPFMNIRLAQESDWEVYRELLSGMREVEPDDLYLFKRVVTIGDGRYEDGYRRCKIFLIEIHGKVVGMGGVSFLDDKGYLEGGIIFPAYRSYGFYRPLIEYRIAFLETMGVSSIEIGTANPRVRKVIKSLGFENQIDPEDGLPSKLYYIKRIDVF